MATLVIVESPAKAKTIEKFLGKNYKIEASMGHVIDLPKSNMGVDIDNNFKPQYITIRGKGDLINKLKKEAKKSDNVLLATDPDREGEAISWHLANALNIDINDKCRISFNEITKDAVQSSIKQARPIDMMLVDSQQTRRILDRIVGYKISPLLWKKVKKGLSAGRVQSVATRLVVDREEEIEKFVPKEYWSIISKLLDNQSNTTFNAKFYGDTKNKIELPNEEKTNEIIKAVKKEKFIVNSVKKGEKKRTPHAPFITSTLQQEAARKLGYTTKKTMMIAQQLYEGIDIKGSGHVGLITYMRTDSVRVSKEAVLKTREFIENKYGKQYVPSEFREYKSKKNSQDAHEAIRPSDVFKTPESIKDSLTPEQHKLYKLIWDRFVSSQMTSAILDTMQIDIKAGQYIFKASGSKIRFDGFLVLYEESVDENQEEEEILPELKEGQVLTLKKLDPKQHFTQPPSRYTEATLVKALEEHGIGRPSTYAPTIATIQQRNYVQKDKKFFKPTELGKIVTKIMKEHFKEIVDIEFTAHLEQQLDDIADGDANWIEVLKNFYGGFSKTLAEAEVSVDKIKLKDEESDVICEKCGRTMVYKIGRFGKFLACPGFPECRNTKAIQHDSGVLCPKCSGKILEKKSKKGRKYFGCENNPKCDYMTWDTPLTETCPKCNSFLLKKSGKKGNTVCSNENCDYEKQSN